MMPHEITEHRCSRSMCLAFLNSLRKPAADVQADRSNEHAKDEWHSPTPLIKLFFRQGCCKDHADQTTDQDRELLTVGLPGCDARTLLDGCGFEEICRGWTNFTTAREPLNEPRDHQDDRRQQTDLSVCWRDADEK